MVVRTALEGWEFAFEGSTVRETAVWEEEAEFDRDSGGG